MTWLRAGDESILLTRVKGDPLSCSSVVLTLKLETLHVDIFGILLTLFALHSEETQNVKINNFFANKHSIQLMMIGYLFFLRFVRIFRFLPFPLSIKSFTNISFSIYVFFRNKLSCNDTGNLLPFSIPFVFWNLKYYFPFPCLSFCSFFFFFRNK